MCMMKAISSPEEVAVSSSGEPFEDACDDIYTTLKDAINEWLVQLTNGREVPVYKDEVFII